MSTSELYLAPPGHLLLQLASIRTAAFHCALDPRASYYLYVPSSHPISRRAAGEDTFGQHTKTFPLVVVVHGSGRDAEGLRDAWSAMAEKEEFVLLSPLFPCDMKFPDGVDNYKRIVYGSVRYDDLLLNMVDTVSRDWKYIETDRFCLAGFSGGGQFVHRFWYLHPGRIKAISIGAPGNATPLRPQPWPSGIADTSSILGHEITPLSLKDSAIQLVVGSDDNYHPLRSDGQPAALSRLEVIRKLSENYQSLGLRHEIVIKEGVRHEQEKLQDEVQVFVAKHLK